jgi:hypothetical protein
VREALLRFLFVCLLSAFLLLPGVETMAQERKPPVYQVNTPGDTLNLRTEPGARDAATIAVAVPHGTQLQATGRSIRAGGQTWIEIAREGRLLWAAERYLRRIDPERPTTPEAKTGTKRTYAEIAGWNFAWDQYPPVIRIGQAGWKNVVFMFWSHTSRESALAFDRIIRKLTPDIDRKDVIFYLHQIAGPDDEDIREASILLCVPFENYARFVTRYFDLLRHEKEGYSPAVFRKIIRRAAEGYDLPDDLDECSRGRPGFERKTVLDADREALHRNYAFDRLPAFFLNARPVEVHDVEDLRARFLKE